MDPIHYGMRFNYTSFFLSIRLIFICSFFRKAAIGGMSAGALGQFMASPTDLVKVQIQMEGKRRLEGKPPRVKNAFHAFQKIMKEGGIRGLWKGWVPNVQRAALVNLGDLTTYDTAKRYILRNSQLKDTSVVHIMSRYKHSETVPLHT